MSRSVSERGGVWWVEIWEYGKRVGAGVSRYLVLDSSKLAVSQLHSQSSQVTRPANQRPVRFYGIQMQWEAGWVQVVMRRGCWIVVAVLYPVRTDAKAPSTVLGHASCLMPNA